jgi:hypothetical protein
MYILFILLFDPTINISSSTHPKQVSDECYCQTPDESVQRVKRENVMLRDKGCQNPGETHILKKNVPIWTSFSESSKTSFPLAGAMNYDFSC